MNVYDRLYVAGSWTAPSNPELLDIRSPHDRSVIGRAAQARRADVDRAVAAARAAFEKGTWRTTAPLERVAVLRRFNALREANAERIASLISAENGSAVWFTLAGQPGLTRQANAYLKAAEEFDWEETLIPSDPASPVRSVVRREALGVVAAVIPWNSPFSSATSKIIPALLAGNSVVLKVSPENSLSMGFLAELVEQLGLPEGV
ncbi:aldehyde dehydrogenase family protein, partial [Streptomyces sp. NPDC055134]